MPFLRAGGIASGMVAVAGFFGIWHMGRKVDIPAFEIPDEAVYSYPIGPGPFEPAEIHVFDNNSIIPVPYLTNITNLAPITAKASQPL